MSAMGMDDLADTPYARFEDAVGRRIGEPHRGQPVSVFGRPGYQIAEIAVQYLFARSTLELVGDIAEAITLLRHIVQNDPRFKDAAYRANKLSSNNKQLPIVERIGIWATSDAKSG